MVVALRPLVVRVRPRFVGLASNETRRREPAGCLI